MKSRLRRQMLALRNARPQQELDALSSLIFKRLIDIPHIRDAQTISTYLHKGSEVQTDEMMRWALREGKKVIIPITDRDHKKLLFSEVRHPDKELEPGTFGILEPNNKFRRIVQLEKADVVLVPGLAWDRLGYRLGYGAGLYDRSINALTRSVWKIGLAYSFQVVQAIPAFRYDRRVEQIVTDRETIITAS